MDFRFPGPWRPVSKMANRPIGVDLFSGAGGLTLGFEQAGFDVLAAVELDPIHCATHEFNFPFWSILCSGVGNLDGGDIRKRSSIGNRDIDVVFGGPPCQGFSMIGKRLVDDPRNSLIGHFGRLVLDLKPKYFVMENVAGILVGEQRKILAGLIRRLKVGGYGVVEPVRILNAVNYGVPQDRRRMFLYGARKGLALPAYPAPSTFSRNANRPRLLLDELVPGPSVSDALAGLPEVGKHPELFERDWTKARLGAMGHYAAVLRGIAADKGDFSYGRVHDHSLLTSSFLTVHTEKSKKRFAGTKCGSVESVSRFYRLDPDGVSNTLRAGSASDHGAFTSPRPIHPKEPRCITVREAARLHSYPDWFRFHVTKWHGFRQVGNSVPPFLGRSVAGEIAKAIGIGRLKPVGARPLGNPRLLEMTMSEAAEHFGVDPHVIEPRTRREDKERAYA